MAKFRQNHTRQGKAGGNMIKIILFVLILGVVLFYLMRLLGNINFEGEKLTFDYSLSETEIQDSSYHIPANSKGEIIHHKHYSLSYIEEYEQAEWVAYVLSKAELKLPNVPRAKRFEKDPKVRTESAEYYDYRGSGYSRGHLAPAGDMAFSREAMEESFFMSNMSPQKVKFNGGVWNELENLVRDWAFDNEQLIVVTGPIFSKNMEQIGKAKVAVPRLFYKVLLDYSGDDKKAVGFILPNEISEAPISEYMVSVDEVEERTGLNFFEYIIDEDLQNEIESSFDLKQWPLDDDLYRKRIEQWNKRG